MKAVSDTARLPLDSSARRGVLAYLVATVAIFVLMMIFGLLMRAAQAQAFGLDSGLFYQIMTVHGIGTVGAAGLGGAMICWYFLRHYVVLSTAVLVLNLGLFVTGVVLILGGAFLGDFAGGWNFLYPLPAISQGAWSNGAAAAFLLGLLLIGSGFLVFYLDMARAILGKYGSVSRALGWPQLFGTSDAPPPPAAVVAATVIFTMNIPGIVVGATILVLNLVSLYAPEYRIDALMAKNMTYFFGHVFMNGTIYQCLIAVFEIMPRHTGRPWKINRWFLGGWTASGLMVILVYPQHLLMDFVMPEWMLIVGQVVSWVHGLPVLLISVFGTLANVHRSGIRWNMTSGLLFFAMLGWAAGVFPGVADATIIVNQVMHNTQWVPGHFHTYFLLSLVSMLFGFGYHLMMDMHGDKASLIDRVGFWLFTLGGFGFILAFLAGGAAGVPRRYAVHLAEWLVYDRAGTLFAAMSVTAALVFMVRFLRNLNKGVSS